ncbi:hypothetical protein [Streptomyces sp. CB03234]|uniref:hypothetical protein n=1 Tax=Streptomyces sp. (strain CB03234) TaxID=1703937 RepID=UPI001F522083|nr:hypothetical protein [Streptomyces sp. CB03234]
MGKTTKKARQTPPLSADRVRTGWQGPVGRYYERRGLLAEPGRSMAVTACAARRR